MNILGNVIGRKTRKAVGFIVKFFFRKNIVWIDNVTLTAEQEIVSNVDWELKVGENEN